MLAFEQTLHCSALLCSALLIELNAAPAQTIAHPVRLARLLDTHPYSVPGVHLCSDDGDWVFLSEGGSLAFFHQADNLNQFAWGPGNFVFPLNPKQTKRLPIGFPAVQPSEMRLDPDADLADEVLTGGAPDADDVNDILYIAGGRLGLWLMEAYPGAGYTANQAARIDDSQNSNPLEQDSSRYCTGVDFVRLGSVDYLVAVFAYARDSRVRFYPLQSARQVLPNAIALQNHGFGAELVPVHEVTLSSHPSAPGEASHPSVGGTNEKALGEPFALDIEIDAYEVGPHGAAHIYLAMATHGIVRITASALGTGNIATQVTWGPMFGTNCPGLYDVPAQGMPPGQNSSGFPASRYKNIDWLATERDEFFDEGTRSDAPQFLDLAVQQDFYGHYLYAAVDHLAWVRFDLTDPWTPSIPIDHHEGEDVSIKDPVRFPLSDYAWVSGTTVVKETNWNPPLVRAIEFTQGSPFVKMPFCREIEVTQVERSPNVFESVVVALYTSRSWNFTCRGGRAPGLTYDNTLSRSGNVSAKSMIANLQGENAVAFHWTADIPGVIGPGRPFSFDGYFLGGGWDVYVPPVHSVALTGLLGALRVIHGRIEPGPDYTSYDIDGSCVSYFRMDDLTPGTPPGAGIVVNAPSFIRDFDAVGGRYAFGMGYSLIDDNVLLTSFQEAGIGNDGILYTPNLAPTGPADWRIEPLDGVHDERGIVGLVFEQECQWVAPRVSAPGPSNSNWTWGQIEVVNSTNHWRIDELLYTPGATGGPPSVGLGSRWRLNGPFDRWKHNMLSVRPEHLGGMVSATYDVYTRPLAALEPPIDRNAETFVFATRGSTCDGLQLLARNQVESDLGAIPAGGPVIFKDPRLLQQQFRWRTCQLDTHPEWNSFAALEYDINDPTDPAVNWTNARSWWRENGISPLQLWAGASRTWPPEMVKLSANPGISPRDQWVIVVPCGHASCPPGVSSYSGSIASGGLGLPAIPSSFNPSSLWASQYNQGFLQLFNVSDPWQLIRDSSVMLQHPTLGQKEVFPPIKSTLDPLFLPDLGSHAYRISTVVLGTSPEIVLAFVADFSGRVFCFDVTDMLANVIGAPRAPVAIWTAQSSLLARSPFDLVHNNIRAIATDVIDSDEVLVYIGVSRVGIISIPYRHGIGFGFDVAAEHRIKTPGEVWGLEIRPATPSSDRILLCTDSYCGMRIYGLVDLTPVNKDDTSAEEE